MQGLTITAKGKVLQGIRVKASEISDPLPWQYWGFLSLGADDYRINIPVDLSHLEPDFVLKQKSFILEWFEVIKNKEMGLILKAQSDSANLADDQALVLIKSTREVSGIPRKGGGLSDFPGEALAGAYQREGFFLPQRRDLLVTVQSSGKFRTVLDCPGYPISAHFFWSGAELKLIY
jgi:hypothetical protein